MTTALLLAELHHRGVVLSILDDGTLRYRAPTGVLTPELRAALKRRKTELVALLGQPAVRSGPPADAARNSDALDAGTIAAVLINSSVLGQPVWLVVDDFALAEHPEIEVCGFPIFFFDEVEYLRGKTVEELQAIAAVKREFPTSRVIR